MNVFRSLMKNKRARTIEYKLNIKLCMLKSAGEIREGKNDQFSFILFFLLQFQMSRRILCRFLCPSQIFKETETKTPVPLPQTLNAEIPSCR